MKNMPGTSISRVYKYFLSEQWFYTVSGTFLQIKSADMLGWNIFLIQGLSMLASPLIQTVKPPDKKPGISDKSSFMRRRSVKFQFVWQNCVTTFPWPGRFKSMLACVIHPQNTKNPLCVGTVLWKRTFYRHDDLSSTCQFRQLKLNLLWTEINFYCLMTNQTPALLVNALHERELQWCYLHSPVFFAPPPPPRAIMPDAHPLGTVHLKIKMSPINGKTRYIMTISRKNRGLWTV